MTIKSIELSEKEWYSLLDKMMEEHGPSIAISSVMRRKLGFTRRWKQWPRNECYLDFWDEKYKTLFLLKYR